MSPADAVSHASAWSPLRHKVFGVLWGATLVSNIGTWIHDVGAGWLMTSLAPSPSMVALVQAATTLPVFLFSLPAGAIADRVDRRRMLIVIQFVMMVLALGMGIAVLTQRVTPTVLLAFTFGLGLCGAAASPTWHALVPRLVAKEDFPAAVALNAVAINLSRTVGPAIGGIIIVALGMAWPFLVNAVSFLAVIMALLWWRPAPSPPRPPTREQLHTAIAAGVRHVLSSAPLRATLSRAMGFFLFASAYWALLPLIARQRLAGGATLYGILVTCIGAGAVTGAQFLPMLRRRLGPDRVLRIAAVGTAVALATFGTTRTEIFAALACMLAGATWIASISTLTVATQMQLPDAMRARGLAVYNTLFYGSLALGSVCWGQIAARLGLATTLIIAAIGALLGMLVTWRSRLQ